MLCTKCGKNEARKGWKHYATCQECEDKALDALIALAHYTDEKAVGAERAEKNRIAAKKMGLL